MAEKARGLLSRLVELWPIVTAMIWLIWATSSWHTEVMMQLKTQDDQIKQIQEYLRTDHDHQKGSAETPNSGLSSIQQKPAQWDTLSLKEQERIQKLIDVGRWNQGRRAESIGEGSAGKCPPVQWGR